MLSSIDITKREIFVSIAITLFMLAFGFFIAESINDRVINDSEEYFKAVKINNDSDLFDYAIRTEAGNILSYGQFRANEPVSDKLIKGKYFSIEKTEEHYTMHTRTVSYKCGESTCTRTEEYWTWDEVGSKQLHTKTFHFLNKDFKYRTINFDNYERKDTVKVSSNVRFVFNVIPAKFNGSLFAKAHSHTITDTNLFADQSISSVIVDKERAADRWTLMFWISWTILIVIIVAVFVAMDNRYLNGKR